VTLTEAFKIKIYILSLDLFTEKCIARTSTRLMTFRTRFTTQAAVKRIQHQTRGYKERKPALIIISAAILREWTEKQIGNFSRVKKRILYTIPPWAAFPIAEIASSKDSARMNYDSDSHILRLRVYTDSNSLNNRITISVVNYNTN
jgi:hypothetical protein